MIIIIAVMLQGLCRIAEDGSLCAPFARWLRSGGGVLPSSQNAMTDKPTGHPQRIS
jgi:hypothetical protein